FLVHDYRIDGSAKRRGKSSMHSSYDDLEEGKKQAICVGDIAYTYSIQAIQKLNFKEEIVLRFLKKFTELIETTCHGEMLDIKYEKKSVLELSEKDIIDCISLKTANYTIAGPLQLGAIVSEIPDSDKNMKLLYDFGMKLGCAFQVQDDILGLIGTEAEIGKPVTSDFSEGKKTLLMKNVFQMLPSGEEKNQLMFKFGKKISPRDYEKIRKIIKQSGAVEKTELFAKNLMLQAKEILEKIAINPKEKKFLKEMADYVIERSK
ncbi:MAG: polyprenyl synthetase family protein, partial [Candidatus Woesearchaeota archaeon]